LTAASPWTLFLSTTLLSETLFAALMTGALLLLIAIEPAGCSTRRALAAGALMGAAVLTRTAGVAPAAAGLLVLTMRRQWAASVRYGLALMVVALPWFVWSGMHATDGIVDPFYSGANYRTWNVVFNYAWADKLAILGVNAFWATQFGQFWGLPLGGWPAWTAAVACTFWIVRGLWLQWNSAAALVCVSYLLLLLAWAFPPIRFMVPVLPLLGWYLFMGAGRLRPLAMAVASLLVISATDATWRAARSSESRGGTWFAATGVDDWSGISSLYGWVGRHTSDEAVLIATHDPTFYLFTGRRAVRPTSMDPLMLYYNVRGRQIDPDVEANAFRNRVLDVKADYVVVTPRDTVASIERLSKRFVGSFAIVQGSVASRHAIYRVDRRRLAGLEPGPVRPEVVSR
jgi:hypothetical protein